MGQLMSIHTLKLNSQRLKRIESSVKRSQNTKQWIKTTKTKLQANSCIEENHISKSSSLGNQIILQTCNLNLKCITIKLVARNKLIIINQTRNNNFLTSTTPEKQKLIH